MLSLTLYITSSLLISIKTFTKENGTNLTPLKFARSATLEFKAQLNSRITSSTQMSFNKKIVALDLL